MTFAALAVTAIVALLLVQSLRERRMRAKEISGWLVVLALLAFAEWRLGLRAALVVGVATTALAFRLGRRARARGERRVD